VRSGGEHRHVHPDLGDHALGGPLGHPGDGVEAVPSLREGASTRSLWVSSSAIDAQVLQVRKGQAHQQGVVVPEPSAPQRLAQLGELGPQPPPGQLRQHLGSRSPATRAASIARPEAPSTSAATESSLIPASPGLLDPLALGGVGLDEPLAVTG
jgi:hypothetical protein